MNKFEIVAKIQKVYKRGMITYEEAIRELKEKDMFPWAKPEYLDWLLYEYEFN